MKILFLLLISATCGWAQNYSEALALHLAGDQAQALQVVSSLLSDSPQDSRLHSLKGRILLQQKAWNESQEALIKALDYDPNNAEAWYTLGEVAFAQRAWQEAIHYYASYSQMKEVDVRDALLKTIYCAIGTSNLAEAHRLVTHLDPMDKEHPAFFFAKAALEKAQGKEQESTSYLDQVRSLYGVEMFHTYFKDFVHLFKTKSS